MNLSLVLEVYADAHFHLRLWLPSSEYCVEVLHECLAKNEDLVGEFAHFRLHGINAKEAEVFGFAGPRWQILAVKQVRLRCDFK